jgi:hypothetical protein
MNITLAIPEPDKTAYKYSWEPEFEIKAEISNGEIVINANKAGLISLAKQFLSLAQDEYQTGCHLHYDESNSLEDGSCEVIINKV